MEEQQAPLLDHDGVCRDPLARHHLAQVPGGQAGPRGCGWRRAPGRRSHRVPDREVTEHSRHGRHGTGPATGRELGHRVGAVRLPLAPASSDATVRIAEILTNFGLKKAEATAHA